VLNVDATVLAEAPKIGPYKDQIRDNISKCLGINRDQVSIKATTTERLGFVGRKEGIAALAIVAVL
ncbi:MAG: 2-C-methyl-D-erythritol 2,4-cyclodiphosphate synthase, partial [Bacillota bacterium]|nr:2-C-methyl-D-erythritol 2,4-cyclodiphosphate synthase [Bacillota bacterium]